jgi:hypothetical protein
MERLKHAMRNGGKIYIGKTEYKRAFRKRRRRWKDNIKMKFKQKGERL